MKNNLYELIGKTKAYTGMMDAFKNGNKHIGFTNMEDSIMALYALLQNSMYNQLILCDNELSASHIVNIINDLQSGTAILFPAEPSHFYFADFHSREITDHRISALHYLLFHQKKIIVAPFEVVLKKMLSPEYYKNFYIPIAVGDILPMDVLIQKLLKSGYERIEQVEGKGQFSIKGGIIDLFNIISDHPIRVEFFDDEIDSIRHFDIESQISIDKIQSALISPTKEILFYEKDTRKIQDQLQKEFSKIKNRKSAREKQLAALFEGYIQGNNARAEDLMAYYKGESYSLIEYFHNNNIFILHQSNGYMNKYDGFMAQMKEDYQALLEKGEVLKNFFDRFYTFTEIQEKFQGLKTIQCKSFHTSKEFIKTNLLIDAQTKQPDCFYGRIPAFMDQIIQWIKEEYTLIIASKNDQQMITLQDMFSNYNILAYTVEHSPVYPQKINIIESQLKYGFSMYSDKIIFLTEKDIFNVQNKEKKKSVKLNKGKKIESFTQLNIGDYVVHDIHGIGVYMGIEQIAVEGIKKDYLNLKYAKGDKLFIPVDQMESIQVYIGVGDKHPRINKLGSGDWKKAKKNTKDAIIDMADDLIKIYAKRRQVKGFSFSKDSQWVNEFEDKFPYEETTDQLISIDEVKKDMEQDIPMDRLLCGDVGYGKTEVAIRAAFKCVMDSKQVALLVPTTILAQQHYNSFIQRFSDYPIKIEMLSRFRTKKQQEHIVDALKKNRVDIVIGTHRLLSKDVTFYDLGLLIIDEEQRFGVKHKEKIKELKTSVDVLSLSATPIPRTLHMSLIGARDMSILNEPPHNRTPVQTYVMEYNDILIRDAIYKELARGGQIYYVYNRVHHIEGILAKVSRMVPEAKIAVAHGQMAEIELERIMIGFMNHDYDILICTTIIESGLDIANVNTIIIEDADQMGLSQLYQLRGRVGRSHQLAYAYITYRKDKTLTEVAHKRLKAIKDFTEFGSGFKIAMRDLEIRGAGNLLGSKQHGHLATVGYDMYCKLLDEAVKELKGEEIPLEINTLIELDVDGFIPSTYVESEKQKYALYKKMINIDSQEELFALEEELEDRYGNLPESVYNLLAISYIKKMAASLKIHKVKSHHGKVFFTFDNHFMLSPEVIKEIIKVYPIQFNSNGSKDTILEVLLSTKDNTLLKDIKELLEKIISTKDLTI
ncbi:MAG: transcription-repair coupling factor [Eubacteriales bacterium]